MRGVKDIGVNEIGFAVKTLHGEQLAQSYRLRHTVFAESPTWVPEKDDKQKMDLYGLWGTTAGLSRDDGAWTENNGA